MNYDLDKIRVACLELMGWRRETSQNWLDKQMDVIWIGPDGLERREGLPLPNPIPEPTKSLDDALPLLKANDGTFIWIGLTEDGEEFEAQHGAFRQVGENAALAVCLLRLELNGNDLDDFKVKP